MPQVPYNPIPQQGPEFIPTPYRTDRGATPEAFGAGVGEAKERFGKTLEQTSDTIGQRVLQIQGLKNQAEQDRLTAQFMRESGAEHLKFSQLQGEAKANYLQTYFGNVEAIRQRVRSQASNSMVQQGFDKESLSTVGRVMFNGAGEAGHAAAEAVIQGNQMATKGYQDAAMATNDPKLKEYYTNRAIDGGEQHVRNMGISDQRAIKEGGVAMESPIHEEEVRRLTSQGRSEEAEQYVEDHKGHMTVQAQSDARDHITQQRDTIESGATVTRLMGANVDRDKQVVKSLDEMQAIGATEADRLHPGDPRFAQQMRNQMYTQYMRQERAQKEQFATDKNTIHSLVNNGIDTKQKMMVTPAGQAVIERLQRTHPEFDIDATIAGENASKYRPANDEMMKTIEGWKNDAVNRDQFLEFDPTDPRYHLSWHNINTIQEWQKAAIGKDPHDDSRTASAINLLNKARGEQMHALHIDKYSEAYSSDYYRFQGTMQVALDEWQRTHGGKHATSDEIVNKIGPAVLNQEMSPGRWWGTNQEEWFKKEYSSEFEKAYLADHPRAQAEEIQREYSRNRVRGLFEGFKQDRARPSMSDEPAVPSTPLPPPKAGEGVVVPKNVAGRRPPRPAPVPTEPTGPKIGGRVGED